MFCCHIDLTIKFKVSAVPSMKILTTIKFHSGTLFRGTPPRQLFKPWKHLQKAAYESKSPLESRLWRPSLLGYFFFILWGLDIGEGQPMKEQIWKPSANIKGIELTNEKRGGLRVISCDRPPFKLISQKFSKESMQAPSCESHKTIQRTLFLLFANNNWFPITLLCLAATHFSHHTLNWNIGSVYPPRYLRWR